MTIHLHPNLETAPSRNPELVFYGPLPLTFGGRDLYLVAQFWRIRNRQQAPECRLHKAWPASNLSSCHSSRITTLKTTSTPAIESLHSGPINPVPPMSLLSNAATCSRLWVSGMTVGQRVFWWMRGPMNGKLDDRPNETAVFPTLLAGIKTIRRP